jgi:predicted HicB family RNase H-like nuclease
MKSAEAKHQNAESLKGNKNASKDPDDRAEAVLHVRCTREQKNAYVKAAQADGVRLASWAKSILDQAIKERSQ